MVGGGGEWFKCRRNLDRSGSPLVERVVLKWPECGGGTSLCLYWTAFPFPLSLFLSRLETNNYNNNNCNNITTIITMIVMGWTDGVDSWTAQAADRALSLLRSERGTQTHRHSTKVQLVEGGWRWIVEVEEDWEVGVGLVS